MDLPSTLHITERIDKLEVSQCTKSKCFPIPWDGEYIGEVLDLYKTASGNCYGSIKPAGAFSELQYLSVKFPLELWCAIIYSFLCSRLSFIPYIRITDNKWNTMTTTVFSYINITSP